MPTQKQRSAAKRNVKKAQSGAKRKQTLKNLPKRTKTALGKEGSKVRSGTEKSRQEYYEEAQRLGVPGRSKMGKADLKRAVQRRRRAR
ncbi:MAG: hypothetical protein ACRDL4_04780 [Thermoleophilaceae bacterium]